MTQAKPRTPEDVRLIETSRVYQARQNRHRDVFTTLSRDDGERRELRDIAEWLREGAERIGRAALRTNLRSWSPEDDRRTPAINHIYAIGRTVKPDPLNPFPPRQPKSPFIVLDIAPNSMPPVAVLLDDKRHWRRAWAGVKASLDNEPLREGTETDSTLWQQTFWNAMFNRFTLSDCVRALSLPENGRGRTVVREGFARALRRASLDKVSG